MAVSGSALVVEVYLNAEEHKTTTAGFCVALDVTQPL